MNADSFSFQLFSATKQIARPMAMGHIRKVVNGKVSIASDIRRKLALKHLFSVMSDRVMSFILFILQQVGASFAGS